MSPSSVTRLAFAKVNLFLDVLGKRSDGTHELHTLFERIDLSDELMLTRSLGRSVEFECDDPAVPTGPENLVVQAAQGYFRKLGRSEGIQIKLKKQIPMGAGLGGGSSDAAAALLALQTLTDQALEKASLLELAKSLGADVPFFLEDAPWGWGRERGDQITPEPLTTRLWHILLKPDFSIPTADIYKNLNLTSLPVQHLTGQKPDATLLLKALKDRQIGLVRQNLYNALESTVEALFPAVSYIKAAMSQAAQLDRPMVSGSGSVLFALCDSQGQAQEAAERLTKLGKGKWRLMVAATKD